MDVCKTFRSKCCNFSTSGSSDRKSVACNRHVIILRTLSIRERRKGRYVGGNFARTRTSAAAAGAAASGSSVAILALAFLLLSLLHLLLAEGFLDVAALAVDHVRLLQDALVDRVVVVESDEGEAARLASILIGDYFHFEDATELVKVLPEHVFRVLVSHAGHVQLLHRNVRFRTL